MRNILLLLPLFFLFISCDDKYSVVHSKVVPAQQATHRNDTLITDTITNTVFSRLNNLGTYGMVYTYMPPDDVKDKPMEIVFSGRARTNNPYSNASIIVTTGSKKDVQLGWAGVNLRYYFTDINTWCYFKDSIAFKREFWHDPYYRIDVFAYLPGNTAENLDIDTLFIKVKVKD